MNSNSKCVPGRIDAFVCGNLTDQEEIALEQHLCQCDVCREALQNASAERDVWDKAKSYLRDDGDDLRPFSEHEDHSIENGNSIISRVRDALAPSDDPQYIGRLAEYEILGVIGSGGMGAVLKAFDRSLNRVVAIKVMAPHLATSGAARKRFAREAQAAAAVTHDNVIDIYGVSEANGLPYLVMSYARGPSLQKRINQRGPLSLVEVLRIGRQIASGLAAAHEQGLVHRDIKPSNILLSDGNDRLLITDFGLARAVDDASVTRTGVIAGTPQYMSPEQAQGETIDQRSDQFSLGSVLYTLCTGRAPFRAESTYGVLQRISNNEPNEIQGINPDIPAWLCRIIQKLHAKLPEDRFESAEVVAKLLEECLAHVQQPLQCPLPSSVTSDDATAKHRRWRSLNAIATVMCIVVGGFALMSVAQRGDDDVMDNVTSSKNAPFAHQIRYTFPTDGEVPYLITMSLELPDGDAQVDGIAKISAMHITADKYELSIASDLEVSRFVKQDNFANPGVSTHQSSSRLRRWNGANRAKATMTDTGELLSHDPILELPYELGALPGLMFQRLPIGPAEDLVNQAKKEVFVVNVASGPATVRQDGETHTLTTPKGETTLNAKTGQLESVSATQLLTIKTDYVQQRIPVQYVVQRLSEDERMAWEKEHQNAKRRWNRKATTPLEPETEEELLGDLRCDRRVMYWLHNLNRRPATSFSPDVVRVLTKLQNHSSSSLRILADRLVKKLSNEQLDAARTTE